MGKYGTTPTSPGSANLNSRRSNHIVRPTKRMQQKHNNGIRQKIDKGVDREDEEGSK